MAGSVADLERAILADARWEVPREQLRTKWASANADFQAMVQATARGQAWLAEHRLPSAGSGGGSDPTLGAELVLAEARARQSKAYAYQAVVDLLGDMLEALADAHVDHQGLDPGAETRTADVWTAAVVCHIRETCRPTQCAVEII